MKILQILALVLLVCSCSTHMTDLSVVSNKNVNLNNINLDNVSKTKNVVGKDSKFTFLFIPFGTPQIKTAINDAMKKADGDLMIDTSVYYNSWWFLVGQRTIEVNGTVVKTRE